MHCCATLINFIMFTKYFNIINMKKSINEQYEFKYQGDSHYIDINTLLSSQFHFSAIVQEVKNQLYPNVDLKIKIKSFDKGSFDVNQIIEITAQTGLFALENIQYIPAIFGVIADYISIKKFLKGKKADKVIEKGDKVEIYINVDGNNNSLTFDKDAFKIYQGNKIINEALKQDIKVLELDDEIKGIQLTETKSKKVVLSVPRNEFYDLDSDNPYLVDENEEDEKVKSVNVGIFKWETIPKKNSKWSLIYENRIVNQVAIKDEEFLKRILDEKLRFGAGDCLSVDLLVKLKKDEYSGMFLEDKFEVIKVHKIIWRGEQTSLF